MWEPVITYTAPPMPAHSQLETARDQLVANTQDLEGATWAIHPGDLAELQRGVDMSVEHSNVTSLHGPIFTVAADPELAGAGPRLLWPGEWLNAQN